MSKVLGFIKAIFSPIISIFKSIRNFFRAIVFLILLTILAIIGFAIGIRFELINDEQKQQVNEALSLYKLPFVGDYFDVPEGVQWTQEDADAAKEAFMETVQTGIDTGLSKMTDVADQIMKPEEEPPKSPEIKISKKEIEQQMQAREAAEKKRISKLARVYASMKADAAAEAMGNLDADTAILILQKMEDDAAAQILAKMDPAIAARLTQMMFEGVRHQSVVPSEVRQQLVEQQQQFNAAIEPNEESIVEGEYVEVEDYVEGEGEYTEEYVEPVEGEYVEGEEVTEQY